MNQLNYAINRDLWSDQQKSDATQTSPNSLPDRIIHLEMKHDTLRSTLSNNQDIALYDTKSAAINIQDTQTPSQIVTTYAIEQAESKIDVILNLLDPHCGLYLKLDGYANTMQRLYNPHDIISINVRCGYFQKVYRIKMMRFLQANPMGCHYCLNLHNIQSRNFDLISIQLQIILNKRDHPSNLSLHRNHIRQPPFNPFHQTYPCTGIKTSSNWKIGQLLCQFGQFVQDNGAEYLWSKNIIDLGNACCFCISLMIAYLLSRVSAFALFWLLNVSRFLSVFFSYLFVFLCFFLESSAFFFNIEKKKKK
eukprot:545162_1